MVTTDTAAAARYEKGQLHVEGKHGEIALVENLLRQDLTATEDTIKGRKNAYRLIGEAI